MTFPFILLFELTLLYTVFTGRVKRLLSILMAQGFLLFGIAYLQLKDIHTSNLIFILVETIIIKGLLIPMFLNRLRKRNNFDRIVHSKTSAFGRTLAITAAIIFGFLFSSCIHEGHLETKFLSVSISTIIAGIYFVMIYRNIITHIVGFLIIENGVFLFSLAVGSEMPMLVNIAILLDIFVGVLVMGIFANRIGDRFEKMHVDDLIQLKD